MPDAHRFGSVPLIADTCVWSKLRRAPEDLAADFFAAGNAGLILSSPVVRAEWLHSAVDGSEFDERDEIFSHLREIPVTTTACNAAISALRELRGTGMERYWRVDLPDLLIAASAAEAAVNVLSDNRRDFAKLEEVLGFDFIDFPAEQHS
ncbi:MAG TPA: PIN domain-containing protein [Solirubrobacteraceae bacterium]|nr:PIN domain-containing protein [Solirubrobacteraceae bacterium]